VIEVSIRPRRRRDRRRNNAVEQARQLLLSLKSYLMAHEKALSVRLRQREGEGKLLGDGNASENGPNQDGPP
jgi:hypothetical protein